MDLSTFTPVRAQVLRAVALGHIYRTREPVATALPIMQHVNGQATRCMSCGLLRHQNVSSAVRWLVGEGLVQPRTAVKDFAILTEDGEIVAGAP